MSDFLSDVCWLRAAKGFILSVILHTIPLSWFLAVNTITWDLIYPWAWFWNLTRTSLSPYTWLRCMPLFSILMAYSMQIVLRSTTPNEPCKTRYQTWASLFNRWLFFKLFTYLLLGLVFPLIYTHILGQNILYDCNHRTKLPCLNYSKLFAFSTTVWVASYQFFRKEFTNFDQINLNIIPQPMFQLIRARIPELFREALKESVIPCILSPIVFLSLKPIIIIIFSVIVDFRLNPESFLNFYDVFYSWLISSCFLLTLSITKMCVTLSLTTRFCFNRDEMILGLKCDNPLAKNLAYYDLYLIANQSGGRRSEVFALSQPGGPPHFWKEMSQHLLAMIADFSSKVENLSGQKTFQPTTENPEDLSKHGHMRSLTRGMVRRVGPREPTSIEILNQKLAQLIENFQKLPSIEYIFGDVPEIQAEQLLKESQVVIYGAHTLSDLAVAALIEDRFGVVLESFPSIVNVLLGARTAVEQIGKFIQGPRKYQKKSYECRIRDALRFAVRRSLYKIAHGYSKYLNDLPLDRNSKEALASFINI